MLMSDPYVLGVKSACRVQEGPYAIGFVGASRSSRAAGTSDFGAFHTAFMESGMIISRSQASLRATLEREFALTIPDRVTAIEGDACALCSSPTSVMNPGSVTAVGDPAFGGCSSLTSVRLPRDVHADESLFHGCPSLGSVTMKMVVPAMLYNAVAA